MNCGAESRGTPRRRIDLPVRLFADGVPVAVASAVDASAGGLFVVPRPSLGALRPGSPFDVGLSFECDGVTRRFRIPVRVAHQHAGGLGLALACEDAALTALIGTVLEVASARRGGVPATTWATAGA